MISLDLADRCRRLAREVVGDPQELALLRLADDYDAGLISAITSPTERHGLRAAAESRLKRAQSTRHAALREVCHGVADSYSKLACV